MKYEITAVHRFSNGSGEPPISFTVRSKEVAAQIVERLKKQSFIERIGYEKRGRAVKRYATVLVREVAE